MSRLKLLSRAQKRLLVTVLVATALLLANAAYLALSSRAAGVGDDPHQLPITYQAMLAFHVVLGIVVFFPALGFAAWHLKKALLRRTPGAIPTGLFVISVSVFLFVSGLLILTDANSRDNEWAFIGHQIAAALLPLAYLGHRLCSKDRPDRANALRYVAGMLGFAVVAGLFHVVEVASTSSKTRPRKEIARHVPDVWKDAPVDDPFVPFRAVGDVDPESPFFPSATTTTTGGILPSRILHQDDYPDREAFESETRRMGFAPSHFLGAQTCQRCHPDVVAQWATSVHRFASFNNPFYRKAVELTRETAGKKESQWCGGCHDPAVMLAGNMTKDIDPLTPESQAGLTCLACHAIDRIHNNTGNGNYNIQDELPSPYMFDGSKGGIGRVLHDYVIKAKPTVHKRRMLQPFFRTSEFCATCHKVSLDVPVNRYRWIRGQNDYDAWHNSGVPLNQPMTWYQPPKARECQDCHMPLEEAPLGDLAAKSGKVRSHRFLAVNTALPHIRGDNDTVRRLEADLKNKKLTVDVFALHREDGTRIMALDPSAPTVRQGEILQVDVVVRNVGVGHTFPGGTNDSNQGWIDFRVAWGERPVWRSGALAADRHVDPKAHFYQAILVDRHGQRIAKRNAADIYATVYANVIPPSTSDIARYRFQVPTDASGEITISADLLWRKFNRSYTEFVFEGQAIPDLPITRIAGDEIRLLVSDAPSTQDATVARAEDWMRWNDYGIGSILDGETRGALASFETVARLQPDRVDGWRNQARVFLTDGSLKKAEQMMRRATEVAPDDPQNAFFWGRILEETGGANLEKAVDAYRRTLQQYPESRDAWARLGRTYWLLGRARESLDAWLNVLKIDPEHRLAHYQRMLAYRALAQETTDQNTRAAYEFAAGEAEKAFEKYKLDENAAAVTKQYRLLHPEDNLMSQTLVIHEQERP